MSDKKITWLASYAKSGNTWVRLFLSRVLLGDAWTINSARSLIPYFLDVVKPRRTYVAEDLSNSATAREVASTWIPIQNDIVNSSNIKHRNTILVKTHNAFVTLEDHVFSVGQFSEKAVFIVRDPRDVLVSLSHHLAMPLERVRRIMTNRAGLVLPEAGYFPEFWSDWSTHLRSWRAFNLGPVLVIRYEDLIAEPATQFQGLLDFLGWTDAPSDVAAAVRDVGFDRLQKAEADDGFVESAAGRRFFRRGVAGGWRDHPEQDHFRHLEDAFADDMAALGYR